MLYPSCRWGCWESWEKASEHRESQGFNRGSTSEKWQEALEDRQLNLKVEFDVEEEDRLILTVAPTYLRIALDHLIQNGVNYPPSLRGTVGL